MRSEFSNHQKEGMFFISLGLLMGFGALLLSQPSWAAAKDPNTTLCADTSSRSVGTGSGDDISAGEKVKTGTKPLFLTFQTTVNNGLTFHGGTAELTMIQAPSSDCKLSKIVVNIDAGCLLASTDTNDPNNNGVKVNFTCTGGDQSYNLGDPVLTPPNQNINIFNGANALLGLGIDLSACNTVDTNDQKLACANAICGGIKEQLTNGNTKAISTAGDLGTLIGSMQTTLDRCTASSSVFQYTGAGSASGGGSCSPDDVAAATALALLLGAPQEHIQIDSSGAGVYGATILADSTLFSPGDFANIDMNTCVATFLQQ